MGTASGGSLPVRALQGSDRLKLNYPLITTLPKGARKMASAGSHENPAKDNSESPMLVDEGPREKRKAQTQKDLIDVDDETASAIPVAPDNPPATMTLDELVRFSITQNEKNFQKMDREMGKLQRDGAETRRMAARAVTTTEETKQRVDGIEQRLAKLEDKVANPTPSALRPQSQTTPKEDTARNGWNELGGETGDTIVLGGFRAHSTAEERREELEEILKVLPEALVQQIATRIIPEPRTNIVLLKIHPSPQGIQDTRRKMLAWCKEVRANKYQRKIDDEPTREIYASPSKPFAMRQRDAQTHSLHQTLKNLFPPDQQDQVALEISTGRVFFQRSLIASRPRGSYDMQPNLDTLKKHLPDITMDAIKTKQAEVEKERERIRDSR